MKTSICPPHARPTLNAISSLMPYGTRRGWSSSSTCLACSTTSFSTQPPETEPTNSPSSAMAILAPGRRGAEPYAWTTVATATFLPASRQRSISGSSSFISEAIRHPTLSATYRLPCTLHKCLLFWLLALLTRTVFLYIRRLDLCFDCSEFLTLLCCT